MRAKSFSGMVCSIAGALEAVGDRWGFLILRDLALGLKRFDDLQRSTDIPPRTLASRLKALEASGMIDRRPYQDNPPRFDYGLTEKGREFLLVLLALVQWGDRYDASGAGAAPVVFVEAASGRRVKLAVVDAETGAIAGRVRPIAGPGADAAVHWRLGQR